MKSNKKIIIIAIITGIGLFGYSQYASASQIGVIITESQLLEEGDLASAYNLQLEFDNPSLLILTAGETEFVVSADEKKIGDGALEPFVLPAMDKTLVSGTFVVNSDIDSEHVPQVKISGVTKYDLIFTSVDVPFVFYPTEQQAREFIHQN